MSVPNAQQLMSINWFSVNEIEGNVFITCAGFAEKIAIIYCHPEEDAITLREFVQRLTELKGAVVRYYKDENNSLHSVHWN